MFTELGAPLGTLDRDFILAENMPRLLAIHFFEELQGPEAHNGLLGLAREFKPGDAVDGLIFKLCSECLTRIQPPLIGYVVASTSSQAVGLKANSYKVASVNAYGLYLTEPKHNVHRKMKSGRSPASELVS